MNILTDTLPVSVEIGGVSVPIVTDWRACLRVILAFEDNALVPEEKNLILLHNLYGEIPQDVEEATRQATWFLNGGETGRGEDGPRLFSFSKDARFIFAAFRQTHGIDLETAEMHWWKFLALFMDIGGETTFSNLVALRKRVKSGKATKEEREAAREMGDLFEIDEIDDMTLEERDAIANFERLIGKRQK